MHRGSGWSPGPTGTTVRDLGRPEASQKAALARARSPKAMVLLGAGLICLELLDSEFLPIL